VTTNRKAFPVLAALATAFSFQGSRCTNDTKRRRHRRCDNPEPNVTDGWNDQGQPQPHDKHSKVRVAGSMNTSISDLSKFTAALVRGDGLSTASRAEMTKPSMHLGSGRHGLRRPSGPRLLQRRA
jgi:hypothetical protein